MNESNSKLADSADADLTPGGLIRPWLAPLVALAVVAADQITKHWALNALNDGPTDVALGARFNLYFNDGASFSIGAGFGPVFGVAAIVVSLWLIWMARNTPYRGAQILLGTIAGGAIGNVIDRLFRRGDGFLRGLVVDFIDLGWWPVFNVADIAIVCGVVLLILWSLKNPDLL